MEGQLTRTTLVERLRNLDDQDAWRDFFDIYGPMVYRLGRRRGLSPEAADGLVQAFCARAVELLPDFRYARHRGGFRSWVLTIALNMIRNDKRHDGVRRRLLSSYLRCRPRSDGDGLESWWQREESRRILQVALARLTAQVSPRHAAMLRLLTVEEMSVDDVARAYGLPGARVAVIKHRLLRSLRSTVRALETQCAATVDAGHVALAERSGP